MRNVGRLWHFIAATCCCCGLLASTLAVAPRQPIGSGGSLVADWVYAKTGGGQQLWKYQGALYDPLDGRRVASVEGLEWVSLLRQNETEDRPIYSQVLRHPNATWKCAATMLSKHIFCYTIGDNNNNLDGNQTTSTALLRKIRVRPYSPEKMIPLEQAAAVYETTTTLIERPNGEVVLYSEWPSMLASPSSNKHKNKTIQLWGVATISRSQEEGTMGFSIYCKRRSPKSPLFLPDLTKAEEDSVSADGTSLQNGTNSIVVSPKRAKWVQFGISNMETKHKFGARETYSMTAPALKWAAGGRRKDALFFQPWKKWFGFGSFKEDRPNLCYTRYGEGPPFYAPGRMCMLELRAEPITSLEDAPPVVQQLLKTQVQGWTEPRMSYWGDSDGTSKTLQLLPEPGAVPHRWTVYKGHALGAWERARSLTNVVSFFRKEHGFWRGG